MKRCFVLALVLGFLLTFGVLAQQLEIHHINVGQADATLIKSPTGVTMLIDGGNTGNGTNIIRPYLTSLGITSLNYVVCSHYHADHIGGLDEVINGMGVANIGSVYDRGSDAPLPTTVAFNEYVTAATAAGRYKIALGQILDLGGGVTMKCVATDGEVINYGLVPGATGSENDLSVGWLLNYNTFQYFTGGDLGGESTYYADNETPLAPQVGDVDAFKINHHGSQYSTNQTFVNTLKPEVGIIPVGINTYGHPTQVVLDRLAAANCYMYQIATGSGGTIPVGKGVIANNHVILRTSGTSYTVSYGATTNSYPGDSRVVETFFDGNFTANPVWGGTTTTWSVVASSDVAAGATNSNTLRLNVISVVAGTQYLSTQRTASWGTSQSWSFWLGRRAQAATVANHSIVWLWANETNLTSATVDGYRIRFGDDVGGDNIVLQSVTNGVATDILTSSGSVTNALTDIGFMVRVTRTTGSVWTVYTSTLPTVSGGGAVATSIPSAANTTVSQGSVTNSTYTSFTNGYFGFMAVHSTGADARAGAELDQLYFDISSSSPLGKPVIIAEEIAQPLSFQLSQNYPNPFNPATIIKFHIPDAGLVNLKVYNLLGQEVATLVNGYIESGSHEVVWDAGKFPSGVYLYKLSTENYYKINKMMLIK